MLATSTPVEQVIARVLGVYKGWGRETTPAQMRADWDNLFGVPAGTMQLEHDTLGGVPAAWIGEEDLGRGRIIIYLHGGGYQVGSIVSHYDLMQRLSAASGAVVLGVSYRLAPEHVFPAPLEDCCAVYDALLARGVSPNKIAFVGDSAGGNLALVSALKLRDEGKPLPAALGLMSPWTDLEAGGISYHSRAGKDPIHQRAMILRMAGIYLGGAPADAPLASPLKADLTGLPPSLIHVGDRETVLSDATDLSAKLRSSGCQSTCRVWDEMIHVFQQFPSELPEAVEAIEEMGAFLSKHLSGEPKR